jgi:very-short-patch-repair endonuclease
VESWWARRQWSKGLETPYPVGAYRHAWAPFPALGRQYHADLNAGIVLSQVPPAADVLLQWQRSRPGRERRQSAWCPECADEANPSRIVALPMRESVTDPVPAGAGVVREPRGRRQASLCDKTPDLPVGEAFASACAPKPASAVEDRLRADVHERLALTTGMNAVRVRRPFFTHVEVWPDLVFPELRIAIEYDSIGRHGVEHVGRREEADRRKDRALRSAGWEVVRLRTGKLEAIGPYDLQLTSWNGRALDRLVETLRTIRGPLLVDAYLG